MSEGKMLFIGVVIAMICVTTMVTHCTYRESECRQAALKERVPTEQIRHACNIGN